MPGTVEARRRIAEMAIHDVAVVGGGPAGACAARGLAEAGRRVVLLEKHALPRYKTCGGGLVGRALAGLPPAVRAAVESVVVERSCHTAELHLREEHLRFATRRRRPVIAMVMRDRFDAALVAAAEKAGAEVRTQCEVRDVTLRHDRVELATPAGPVMARFVVAADGATSLTARKAGWGEPRRCASALEAEVSVSGADFTRLAGAARFDFGVIPAGYGWVFPKGTHLSIGVASTWRGGVNLHASLARYLEALGLGRLEHIEKHGFLIPLVPRREGVMRGRVLLVGDAAGLADPLTGEGISAAIESGTLAARVIHDANGEPAQLAARYEHALDALRRELRIGRLLGWITYDLPRVRGWVFRTCGQTVSEGVTDILMGERTYASIMRRAKTYAILLGLRKR
jgi:geranylgeranyl reductase family protein